jgi:signal transduction histidine kinase
VELEAVIASYSQQKYDEPELIKGKLNLLLNEDRVIKNDFFTAKCFSVLGEVYRILADTDSARICIEKAIEIRSNSHYPAYLASSHEQFARLLFSINEDSAALNHLYNSLELKLKVGNENYIKSVYSGLGNAYFNLSVYDSAEHYYLKSLELDIRLKDTTGIANSYTNIGNVYHENENYSVAMKYYRSSLELYMSTGSAGRTLVPNLDLGICHFNLENFDSALYYYNKALIVSNETGNQEYTDNIVLSLAEVYSELGQSDSAVVLFEQYIDRRDSFFEEQNDALILEYDSKYKAQEALQQAQFEKTEKEKALVENKNSRLTIYLLLSAFGIIAIALFFWRRILKQKSKLTELEMDVKNQEIDNLLKTQEAKSYAALLEGQNAERERIAQDLHDQLGGTLSAVKVHFGLMDQKIEDLKSENRDLFDKVNGMLSEAVQDVRRISHDLASGRITKLGLKGALEDLAEILNTAKKLEVDFYMDDSLPEFDKKKEQEIYAMIQEIISNTLKHANAQAVELQLNRNDNMLNIIYEDNGVGFVLDDARSKGLGLAGINNRVDKLGGNVNYDSVIGRGTIIIVNIPL